MSESEYSDAPGVLSAGEEVLFELALNVSPEQAVLTLPSGAIRRNLQPWALDAVGIEIKTLGHHDEVPRPWEWENVLTLLEPGEELLYILDHQEGRFSLKLILRFPIQKGLDRLALVFRKKRAAVVMGQVYRQAFPGTEFEWLRPDELLMYLRSAPGEGCVAVTGMPSPRDLDDDMREMDRERSARSFQSLNDVVEPLYDTRHGDYRMVIAVQRVSQDRVAEELKTTTSLYDAISPLVTSNRGESISRGRTEGTTQSDSRGGSATTGTSKTKGTAKTVGLNASLSAGLSATVGGTIGATVGALLGPVGASIGASVGASIAMSTTASIGASWSKTRSESDSEHDSTSSSWDTTRSKSKTTSLEEGETHTREYIDSRLRLSVRSLERKIEGLYEANGTGAFRWAGIVYAEIQQAHVLGRSLMAVLSGSRTKDHPLMKFEVRGVSKGLLTSRHSFLDVLMDAAPILPLPRVRDALLLPEAELPGLSMRRNVFMGRNSGAVEDMSNIVEIGPDAFTSISDETDTRMISISVEDLSRHVLVAGATGAGKTVRVASILNRMNVEDTSIIVFETAKTTYRTLFGRIGCEPPIVYRLGSSESSSGSRFRPLRINPFYFELGTSLKRHMAGLSNAFSELMPTEAMIGPLLKRAIERSYEKRGWDIEAGRPMEGRASWPTVIDFVREVRAIAATLNYGPEVNANYRGALESRASLFLDPSYQDIFAYGGNTPIDVLFEPGRDAIIEVDELPPGEIDIRAFVMVLLLQRLRSTQEARKSGVGVERLARPGASILSVHVDGPTFSGHEKDQVLSTKRNWLLVFEEAHNVLDRQYEERRPGNESNSGRTLLRAVVRLLQEGRELGMGLMVVDQTPSRLSRDVIANTGTKIAMRLEDSIEMEELGRAMGMTQDEWEKLGFLRVGEALVKTTGVDRPTKSAPVRPVERKELVFDRSRAWSPSFRALARHWRPVFTGDGPEPGAEWLEELLEASNRDVHLAVFGGVRELLKEPNDVEQALDVLSDALANTQLTPGIVLDAAKKIRQQVVVGYYRTQLQGAGLMILCVSAQADPNALLGPDDNGCVFSSHALATKLRGSRMDWTKALVATRLGSAEDLLSMLESQVAGREVWAPAMLLWFGWIRGEDVSLRVAQLKRRLVESKGLWSAEEFARIDDMLMRVEEALSGDLGRALANTHEGDTP